MVKVVYTMSNGEKVTQSNCSFKDGAPYESRTEAQVDMTSNLKEYQ
jgi:hypothetical protein